MKHVRAVILAGGRSSRLFPFNKVLADLTGSGRTLLQQSSDRLSLLPSDSLYVLAAREMVVPVRRQLRLPASHVFVDPIRRGTWPALLWAMAHLRGQNSEAVMAVVTGDHVIPKMGEFQRAFRQAVRIAQTQAAFVVIPVSPTTRPEEWTGFGAVKGDAKGRIVGFEEKPSLARAQQMIKEGGWSWNAGMFFFCIAAAESVLKERQPEVYRTYLSMAEAISRRQTARAAELFKSFPEKIPHPLDSSRMVDHTIDYAVMMPLVHRPLSTASAWVTRQALTRWTDLGQWTALRQVVKADRQGNIRIGNVQVGPHVRDSILVADHGHRIEVSGVENLIVAFAGGKALVLPQSDIARIKEFVASQGSRSIIGEKRYIVSFARSKRRNVAILSNRLKEAI